MEKLDITQAIEEDAATEKAGEAPLRPEEFKKIKRVFSPGKKLIRKTIEERMQGLRRRIQKEPAKFGHHEKAK